MVHGVPHACLTCFKLTIRNIAKIPSVDEVVHMDSISYGYSLNPQYHARIGRETFLRLDEGNP
jgi:hypothetical protein